VQIDQVRQVKPLARDVEKYLTLNGGGVRAHRLSALRELDADVALLAARELSEFVGVEI
jgi:hypothetical protein